MKIKSVHSVDNGGSPMSDAELETFFSPNVTSFML